MEKRLKSKYLKPESLVSCLEWDVNHKGSFKLEDIYVNIQLGTCNQSQSETTSSAKCSFYDHIKRNGTMPVNVCVLSGPGKGKSILAKQIVMDYAQNSNNFINNMKDLSLVVLIHCKELLKYRSLHDYIVDMVIKEQSYRKRFWMELLEENCEKCLFLVDGLDQVYYQRAEVGEELLSLLQGHIYHGASILATTRPSGLDTIEKQLALFEKNFVILPLSTVDIKVYISKYFSEKDEQYCTDLYNVIVNNDNILELASSPLALSIICNIHDHSECIPQSMTQLYHELVRQMIQQFKSYHGYGETKNGKRRVSECLLKSVGHVALNSLKAGNDYFEQQDLVDYFLQRTSKKGLLSKAKKWISGINSTSVFAVRFYYSR